MYKKILIPLDNSPTDQTILNHIRPLVKLTGAQVFLVHVAEGFAARLQNQLNLADSQEIKDDQAYLNQQCDALAKDGVKVKAVLLQGKEPAEAILNFVGQEGCDLIAMATHGHGFVKDVILGSVADHLRHNTDTPDLDDKVIYFMSSEIYLKRMFDFVLRAGKISLKYISDSKAALKSDQTVITKADQEISLICREMLADFLLDPAHLLIDEEDPRVAQYLDQHKLEKAKFLWSVDPIDGTRLYANGMPTYGVSLGLLKDLKPWLGVVYFPVLKELFFCDGNYAYFISNAFSGHQTRELIKPIDEHIGPRSLFFCNDTFFRKFNWSDKDFHIMIHACAVVNLCWPTIGRGMGSFLKSNLWDFAGSWPIMKAAGMDFRSMKDGSVIERIEVSLFEGGRKPWELKEYYLISSKRNYDIIKSKIVEQK